MLSCQIQLHGLGSLVANHVLVFTGRLVPTGLFALPLQQGLHTQHHCLSRRWSFSNYEVWILSNTHTKQEHLSSASVRPRHLIALSLAYFITRPKNFEPIDIDVGAI